ncbi:MFS transporter [uncultured Enterovirga sp.]|uniref:MFS transporter n=1 Tax=uncultured Enterovirga sp. TaxID=2026352 RepID=UPI0035CA73A6
MATATQAAIPIAPAGGSAQMRRVVMSSVVGTAVEWYDFLIYGTASALVFNKLFFPSFDPAVGTIAAFASYGVGFLARPLGAAIFGHFGDKVGRKKMLAATIIIMGIGTFLIGCLPTYAQIGIWAPILLVLLRLVQGIGLGGEWGGAVLMVVENAPTKHRGFFGSLVQVGNPIGNIAAIGIFAAMSQLPESEFLGWAWRIPFLISILLVGVGLFIRMRLEETPAFRNVEASKDVARLPVVEVITQHPRAFLTAVGLKISEIAWASIGSVFAISYVTGTLGLPRSVILNGLLAASFVALFSIPLFGWMSDRVGRKTMFYASCLFCIAFAFPFFWLLDTKDTTIITLTIVVAISFGQMVGFGIGAPFYSELFAARLRYSGASLGFQIGAAISGGLTPFAAASLMAWSGGATWPISIYLIVAALITLAATAVAPETAGTELR